MIVATFEGITTGRASRQLTDPLSDPSIFNMNPGLDSNAVYSTETLFQDLQGIERIDALNKKAWELRTENTDYAMDVARYALILSQEPANSYPLGEAVALSHLGICLWIKKEFRDALEPTLKAISMLEKLESPSNLARTCNTLGLIYWRLDQLDLAMEQFQQCYRLYEEMGYKAGVANSLHNMALLFSLDARLNEAEDYYLRSMEMMRDEQNWMGVSNCELNLGFIYLEKKKYDEAIRWFRASLRTNRKLQKDWPSVALCLSNLASAYFDKERYRRVQRLLDLSDQFGRKISRDWKSSQNDLLRARILASPEFPGYDLDTAIKLALQIKEYCRDREDQEFLGQVMEFIPRLYAQDRQLDKSVAHYQEYIDHQKRRFREDADRRLKNLEVAFKVREAEKRTAAEQKQRKELAQLNRELEQLNESKNEFLRMAAHDLRTPLNGVMGLTQAVLEKDSLDESDNENLLMVLHASNHMAQLIDNLLDVDAIENRQTQIQSDSIDPMIVVNDWIRSHRILADNKGIEIQLHADSWDRNSRIQTDPVLFERILANLMSNAVKFSEFNSRIEVRLSRDNSDFSLSIHDGGPGIPENELHQLYKKFGKLSTRPTSAEGSSGLGLYIVKQICNLLGGQIHVSNHPKGGAVFTVKLPFHLSAE